MSVTMHTTSRSLFMWVPEGAPPEVAQAFLDAGADPNARNKQAGDLGWTPLLWAVAYNHLDNVKVLLAGGADVHGTDNAGRTTLMYAVLHGQPESAEALLAAGADVNTGDEAGKTAAMYASDNQRQDIALLLREAGASR